MDNAQKTLLQIITRHRQNPLNFSPLLHLKYINNTIQSDKLGVQKLFKLLSSMFNAHLTSSDNHN
jgi:hypothetical protein